MREEVITASSLFDFYGDVNAGDGRSTEEVSQFVTANRCLSKKLRQEQLYRFPFEDSLLPSLPHFSCELVREALSLLVPDPEAGSPRSFFPA